VSRVKQELNKTSQQKLKKFTKTLSNYEQITNPEEFVEKFKQVLTNDVRSLKGCSERAVTDYYLETITDRLNKHEPIEDNFFVDLKMATRTKIAAFYTNKTFDNNIDIYFNEVKREYILHPQNESNGLAFIPENRDIFIKNNLKLVINCAKRYQGYGLTFEDLIQIGNEGLLIAFEKFDAERGNLRIAINKLIDESPLETFTHDEAVEIVKGGFTYGDDLEMTLNKIPGEGIASKDEFHAWVKKNVKTAVFASVAFQWIRAWILLEINRIGSIVRVPKQTKKKKDEDDSDTNEELWKKKQKSDWEIEVEEYEKRSENSIQVISLDSTNPYTDDCYHDNELADVTQAEFVVEDEAIENMEKQDMFKRLVEQSLYKLNATDRRIIKKRFGIGMPYQLSINEIAEAENLSANKVKYSITSSLKVIGNSFTEAEKIAIMDLL
jgi:DNA-directed RNA polymerase sigma subunit (sigma70/sigma32)